MRQSRTIIQESPQNVAIMDVFSRLVQDRIIFIDDEIDSELANGVIAQMLYLDSLDDPRPISVYINSPGGSVMDGLAIYDVAKRCKANITTVCMGMAASMGAILMLMGDTRCALPHSRIMLHEAAGHCGGKTKDARVALKLQEDLEAELFKIVTDITTIDINEVKTTDKWYTAEEALEVGLITKIL